MKSTMKRNRRTILFSPVVAAALALIMAAGWPPSAIAGPPDSDNQTRWYRFSASPASEWRESAPRFTGGEAKARPWGVIPEDLHRERERAEARQHQPSYQEFLQRKHNPALPPRAALQDPAAYPPGPSSPWGRYPAPGVRQEVERGTSAWPPPREATGRRVGVESSSARPWGGVQEPRESGYRQSAPPPSRWGGSYRIDPPVER